MDIFYGARAFCTLGPMKGSHEACRIGHNMGNRVRRSLAPVGTQFESYRRLSVGQLRRGRTVGIVFAVLCSCRLRGRSTELQVYVKHVVVSPWAQNLSAQRGAS